MYCRIFIRRFICDYNNGYFEYSGYPYNPLINKPKPTSVVIAKNE